VSLQAQLLPQGKEIAHLLAIADYNQRPRRLACGLPVFGIGPKQASQILLGDES
jgi:hypothetical protein